MKQLAGIAIIVSTGLFIFTVASAAPRPQSHDARLNAVAQQGRHVSIQKRHGSARKSFKTAKYKTVRKARVSRSSVRVFNAGRPAPDTAPSPGIYRLGSPYMIDGRAYVPRHQPDYRAEGQASWYGESFQGRPTANGERFDAEAISAAHPTLPLPSYVRVTNLENNRSLVVRVNDRGPYHGGRLIDVSVRAVKLLGFYEQGLAQVRVEYLRPAGLDSRDSALEKTTHHEGRHNGATKVAAAK